MKNWIKQYIMLTVVCVAMLATTVQAQVVSGTYAINLDSSGNITTGSGTGYNGIWTWYPTTQRYIMWFQSTGFDPNRMGEINVSALIEALDPDVPVYFRIEYGWARDTWTSTTAPPLPGDVASTGEGYYMTTQTARTEMSGNAYIKQGEYTYASRTTKIETYHPEWVYMSVSGRNIEVSRNISIESIDFEEHPIGACCNTSTGDCYYVQNGICNWGYIYLGDDSTCTSCESDNFTKDFGDAPSQYPVTSAQNGASHTIVAGTYLGNGINPEADGQPSDSANADNFDDGITFNSQIITGQSVNVTVTASKLGVINAWLDLNLDGDWADAGEQIIADEPVIAGQNLLSFYVPTTATAGQSFIRFRYNSSGGIGYTGHASDGEVEDSAVIIVTGSNPDPDPDPEPTPGIEPVSPANLFASKWNQPIDLIGSTNSIIYGWNIATNQNAIPLLADDWKNSSVLPVQGFRWWGAFDNWVYAEMPTILPSGFHFGIWSHNPTLSKPSSLIWEHTCTGWAWAYSGQIQDAQGQMGGESVFEFSTLLSQDEWFYPSSTPNTVYWLSITPIYASNTTSTTPWGWVTRQTDGTLAAERILSVYNPAEWPPVLGTTYGAGSAVTYPSTKSWDMAFELITSQPGGGSASSNSELANAIGDLNDDGKIDINDLYILLGFVLNP